MQRDESPAELKFGETCFGNYTILKQIGCGGFGKVYKAQNMHTKKIVALKRISLEKVNSFQQKKLLREALVQEKLVHPNIVKYLDSFIESSSLCVVMEYCSGGDLQHLIQIKKANEEWFSEDCLWKYVNDLAQALNYLHSHNTMHRDIKCQNILISENRSLKIADLGLAALIKAGGNIDYAGTPAYFSPEILREKTFDEKVDIWALGCVLYTLAALSHPFDTGDYLTLTKNILHRDPRSLPSMYSATFCNMVFKMLSKSSVERPTIKEILEIIPTIYKTGVILPNLNLPPDEAPVLTTPQELAHTRSQSKDLTSRDSIENIKSPSHKEETFDSKNSTKRSSEKNLPFPTPPKSQGILKFRKHITYALPKILNKVSLLVHPRPSIISLCGEGKRLDKIPLPKPLNLKLPQISTPHYDPRNRAAEDLRSKSKPGLEGIISKTFRRANCFNMKKKEAVHSKLTVQDLELQQNYYYFLLRIL